jgi:hypothetical protein
MIKSLYHKGEITTLKCRKVEYYNIAVQGTIAEGSSRGLQDDCWGYEGGTKTGMLSAPTYAQS